MSILGRGAQSAVEAPPRARERRNDLEHHRTLNAVLSAPTRAELLLVAVAVAVNHHVNVNLHVNARDVTSASPPNRGELTQTCD
jgi:hypothetical protein